MKSLVAVVVLSLVGCGGGGGGYDSVRSAALAIGEALCVRLADCNGTPTNDVGDCVDVFVAAVCDQGGCNAEPKGSDGAINDCINAFESHSCNAEELPGECQSVL